MLVSAYCWAIGLAACFAAAPVAAGSGLARVRYDLWHGDSPSLLHRRTILLVVRDGAPFYDVMLLAANISRAYRFESEMVDGAKYINSIGGRMKNEENKNHWMFYKLQSMPNPARPPPDELLTTRGINGVFISNGDIYLFWFKNVTWA